MPMWADDTIEYREVESIIDDNPLPGSTAIVIHADAIGTLSK